MNKMKVGSRVTYKGPFRPGATGRFGELFLVDEELNVGCVRWDAPEGNWTGVSHSGVSLSYLEPVRSKNL